MPEIHRQKILIITRNLPPLVGGMERLNWHMADELSKYAEVKVIGPSDAETSIPKNVSFKGVPLKPLSRFLILGFWRTIQLARHWKPDIVLAGSGLTAPLALFAARLTNAKAVAYVHGLDIAASHPVYKALWIPAIRHLDKVIANSNPTAKLVEQQGVESSRISIVFPGVSLPLPTHGDAAEFRNDYNLGTGQLLLSIGRLTTRKGLREFVNHALPDIVEQHPDVLLVVIGEAPKDSLHAQVQTQKSIQAVADAKGIGKHLRFLGVITDSHTLSSAYRAASVHVFPVREIPGDPEGFGMVAIEAAAHGLPTVAFATGGVTDAVAVERSGYLAAPADYIALKGLVLQILSNNSISWEASTTLFAQNFSWTVMGRLVIEALSFSKPKKCSPKN
tara:strand:+ start:2081 stop:3253 length:1173 start_codon:yes stop_codon:yes gene_type:complete